jgi:hypothetical protein
MNNKTLEEAAERYADYSNDYVPMSFGDKFNETTKTDFIAGAKWQQERMYSEEEVYSLLEQSMKDCHLWELEKHYSKDYKNLTEWFEQFKKK